MFKLLRYFSIASSIAFIAVAILFIGLYRQVVFGELVESAENKNIALTQAFSNSLWPQFAPFVNSAPDLTIDELRTHPEITNLHQAVLGQMRGLSVIKVKVYDLDGMTVFSTEASQIGEDKSNNPGFLAARSGQIASALTYRDTIYAFEGTIEDRDVFSSYLPIRHGGPTAPIEGVFEVYDDVTPLVQRLEQAQKNVIIGVTLILAILYAVLFFIIRRANQVIQRQYNSLKQSQQIIQASEDRLRTVMETIPNGVGVAVEGKVIYANSALSEMTDYTLEEIQHRAPKQFVHPDDQAYADERIQALLQGGAEYSSEYRLVKKNGDIVPVEVYSRKIHYDGQPAILSVFQDLTERRQAEATIQAVHVQLTQRVKELSIINQITQAATSALDFTIILETVNETLAKLFEADTCGIALLNADQSDLTVVAEYRSIGEANAVGAVLPLADNPFSTKVIETGQPGVFPFADIIASPEQGRAILQERRVQCLMIVPLIAQGQVFGTIGVVDTTIPNREFTQPELKLAETIAGQIATIIENARLFDEEHRQRQLAESLQEVTSVLNRSLDQGTILNTIFEQLEKIIQYDGAALLLHQEDDMELCAGKNLPPSFMGTRISLSSDTPALDVFRDKKPLIIANVHEYPHWETWPDGEKIRGWMGAPLLTKEQVIGILTLDNFEPNTYREEDAQILQAFANQAATAIHNAQLYTAAQQEIAERKKTEAILENKEAYLRRIISSVSDHIYAVEFSKEGTIINTEMVSSNIETLCGYPRHKFVDDGQLWPSLVHPDDQATVLSQVEQFTQGQDSQAEYRIVSANDKIIWVRDSGQVEVNPTTQDITVYGVISDITERKQAEAALILQQQRLRSLYEIATRAPTDIDQQFNTALEIGAKLLDLELGIISHIKDDSYTMLYCYPPTAALASGQTFELGQTFCELTLKSKGVVTIDHAGGSNEHNSHPCYQTFALEAYIGTMLRVKTNRFGTLNFSSTKPTTTPFSQADIDFIQLLGEWVSMALERKQDQETLAQARDEALAASRFKSQLLARVSHELRTPLGSILGYSEILQVGVAGPLTPKQADFLQKIISGTHYLTQMVNELLDQAQFDNGKEKLYLSVFPPYDIVYQVETRMRVLAEEKGLTLITNVSPDLPNTLLGDTKRLQQILMNLVSNAIKFTKTGTVQVRLYQPDPTHWGIQVSDTGIGIPLEAQDTIFEPFQQVDGSITREYTGTGLGLSIVRQFVTLMEGEIHVDSKPEQGSVFTVTLPIKSRSKQNGKSIGVNH